MFLFRIIKKVGKVLSRYQKKHIFFLVILMIIGAGIETLSVSLILPFMEMVVSSDKADSNGVFGGILNILGLNNSKDILVFMAVSLACIFIFKNFFLLLQFNFQNRFVYTGQIDLQRRMLRFFLSRKYEYFLNVDTGVVLRLINVDAINVFFLIQNLMLLASEVIVFGALTAAVFIVSPVITLSLAFLLFLMSFIVLRIIRPILKQSSIKQQKAIASMNKWILQSIRGIKEVKISQKEMFFEEQFGENGPSFVDSSRVKATLSQIPRFMIEGLSMGAFFLVMAVIIAKDISSVDSLIPILSVVVVAALRLLPSVNRISQSIAQAASMEPSLDKVLENIAEVDGKKDNQASDRSGRVSLVSKSIELKDVLYKYPSSENYVLSHVNMVIKKGESVGIMGASGAGKTTAVDVMLGLLTVESGEVMVDGQNIMSDLEAWLDQISYIPQSIFLLNGTIRENVAFGEKKNEIDDELVWRALHDAALDEFVRNMPDGIYSEIGEGGVRLSGGQRQRIGIARALYNNPEILVFDEATSALDNETEHIIMESIKKLKGKKTLVIIAHRLTTIENCDSLYRVENGEIVKVR